MNDADQSIPSRIEAIDWGGISADLNAFGYALSKKLLQSEECVAIANQYAHDELFRSRIVMGRYGFGRGEYKYYVYPLPDVIFNLRNLVYPKLVPIANQWNEAMGINIRYPEALEDFLHSCRLVGQSKPTPLLLQYQCGDYNCLHQDIYGENIFPLQMAILLSKPHDDFTGGEFVVTEQRPRMQSRVEVVPIEQGDALFFPVHHRPTKGTKGIYRVNMRHGVSVIRSGKRNTLGIIFHDAP